MMPIRIPPVAGIITASFTPPINHISLLAKTWGIPDVYRADAGRQVMLDADGRRIQMAFGGRAQDIEWLVVGDRIMIVQSRDYISGR